MNKSADARAEPMGSRGIGDSAAVLPGLALAAIGIVFGDIGTSPLYTMTTVFDPTNGLASSPGNVVGVVSLILWSLLIVVSLKYVTLIMRADNHGEGEIMALLAPSRRRQRSHSGSLHRR